MCVGAQVRFSLNGPLSVWPLLDMWVISTSDCNKRSASSLSVGVSLSWEANPRGAAGLHCRVSPISGAGSEPLLPSLLVELV